MATYVQIFDMQENATFRKQVAVACRVAARDILNEAPATPNHAARVKWAMTVYGAFGPGAVLIEQMLAGVTQNATLQAAAPNGPWADNDIQFVVNGLVDVQAT